MKPSLTRIANNNPDSCIEMGEESYVKSNTERKVLEFLSKVRIEFNALDPRIALSMEFLAQCDFRKVKESNPSCQVRCLRRSRCFGKLVNNDIKELQGMERVCSIKHWLQTAEDWEHRAYSASQRRVDSALWFTFVVDGAW
ncbi:unnamed protein product [Fraxinus pennsylvanica]|uniref:Uncharacterized protein n=1 Tax=Fraxinus pennsylvanica TaxID=56036 RepID=A0AAD2AE78_9LAMI|nr:unnamed protein product [Fraxinus pennsylvanica]